MRLPLLGLALAAFTMPAASAQTPPLLRNTGQALGGGPLRPPGISRTFVAFVGSEGAQGSDLNGDGDLNDGALHIHDLRTGTTRYLGCASVFTPPVVTDRFVAFGVPEESDGAQDLNRDGDAWDTVAFVFDRATGQVRNLGVAIARHARITDRVLAFLASEVEQGADLDGDGALSQQCLYVVNPATGVGTALAPRPALTAYDGPPQFAVSGSRVYWRAQSDGSMWTHDLATHATTNLGLRTTGEPVSRGGVVAFGVSEALSGMQDLNGDGDALDYLLGVVPASGGVPAILALVGTSPLAPYLRVGKHLVLGYQVESVAIGDLNGDGDTQDGVFGVYDDRTGVLTNLRRAITFAALPQQQEALIAAVEGDVAAYAISEWSQGQDLNGDGDLQDATLEVANGAGTILAAAPLALDVQCASSIQISRGHVGFLVREYAQGQDLDGDGFLGNTVPHVLDLVHAPQLTNIGIGTSPELASTCQFDRDRVCFLKPEYPGDLNGDGDLLDNVLIVRGTSPGSALNTAVAAWPAYSSKNVIARQGVVAVLAAEYWSGGVSLNGDADAGDQVLFVLRMNP